MRLHSLTCPNCNGILEVENNLDTFYCKYCGHKIILEGQSDAAYRARTEIAGMAHEERMAREQREYEERREEKNDKFWRKYFIILGAFFLIIILILAIAIPMSEKAKKESSDMQEEKLQSIVEEIQVDIEKGNFDIAFAKAETIDYTEGYNDEIDEKWDNIRKSVKDQIIEAEKEETGKSKHKPEEEEKKFFGLF